MADLPSGSDEGALEVVINDATTPSNKNTVKAASTAAVATDTSLVVALSPNSPLPAGTNNIGTVTIGVLPDLVVTGTLAAINNNVSVAMAGYQGAGFEISTGTLVSTLTPQVSMDGGTTWTNTSFFNPATGLLQSTLVTTNAMPNTQLSIVVPGGVSNVRVDVTGYTSGTANVSIRATTDSMQPVTDAPALAVLNTIATNTGASATDFISTGTITALNGTVSVNGQGVYTVSASITGTWVGTLVAEGQLADNTWVQVPMYQVQSTSLPYSYIFSTTSNGTFLITGGGYINVRIRASAYTSGTVAVALDGSLAQQTISCAQLGNWNVGGYSANTSGSIAGNGNILLLPIGTFGPFSSLAPYAGVVLEISGTWSATLTATGSNGNSYYTIDVINLSNPNAGPQSTITANGLYYVPLGCVDFALVVSNYVSGTVICYASFRSIPPALPSIVDGDVDVTGTLGALNATVQATLGAGQSSTYALISGTWVGTIQFQGSINGSTWVPLEAVQGGPTNVYTTAGFTTNGGVRIALVAGFQYIRAAMTAYTSGTATVLIQSSTGTANVEILQFNAANLNAQVVGNVASGTTDSGNGVKVSGIYNTTVPSFTNGQRGDIQIDSRGAEQTTPLDGFRQTYSASAQFTAAATPTDIFQITGSATKTIRVLRMWVSGIQTTASIVTFFLLRRSARNTGGATAAITLSPHDTNNAAATATVFALTTNPTAFGTQSGQFLVFKKQIPTAASTIEYNPLVFDYGNRPGQAIVLRGTADCLSLSLAGVTVTGNVFDINVEWSEE